MHKEDMMIDKYEYLEAQIRECFGRVVYTHKTHEKLAEIFLDRLNLFKNAQIILLTISTGSFLTSIFGNSKWGAIVGSLISAILLFINTYLKNYDLGSLTQKHKQAANEIWCVREKYLSLLTDIKIKDKSIDDLQKVRDELLAELSSIYSKAPPTNSKAYTLASRALKELEEMTFNDSEINAFLPESLKKKQKT